MIIPHIIVPRYTSVQLAQVSNPESAGDNTMVYVRQCCKFGDAKYSCMSLNLVLYRGGPLGKGICVNADYCNFVNF